MSSTGSFNAADMRAQVRLWRERQRLPVLILQAKRWPQRAIESAASAHYERHRWFLVPVLTVFPIVA